MVEGVVEGVSVGDKGVNPLLNECSDNSENSLDSAVTIAYNNINNCDESRDSEVVSPATDCKRVGREVRVEEEEGKKGQIEEKITVGVNESFASKRNSSGDASPPHCKKKVQSRMKFQLAKERKASTTLGE